MVTDERSERGQEVRSIRLPLDSLDIADLTFVHEVWQRRRGSRRAPARADFDLPDLKSVVSRLLIIEVMRDPLDYVYRFAGGETYRIHGRELTGRSIRQLANEAWRRFLLSDLEELCATWEPQFVRLDFTNQDGNPRSYHVLRLPLSDDGQTVNKIMVMQNFGIDPDSVEALRQAIDWTYARGDAG